MVAIPVCKSKTREYRVWIDMRSRCSNPAHKAWAHYGGRGITVCKRWENFENFLSDMGCRPSDSAELDRVDNNEGYSVSNCRWATKQQNKANTRRTNRLSYRGVTLSISEWARRIGMSRNTFKNRLAHGWGLARAITEGVNK